MRILLIGAGGREHALGWKISQSPHCEQLFIAPGNAGTDQIGTNVYLSPTDFASIEAFVSERAIDLIVIGPEQPLVVGIADYFEARGVPVIGPTKAAALLEGSKKFAKNFMQKYGIATARYASFSEHQTEEAIEYIQSHPLPVVVKASGLAAGKGVLICETHEQASTAVEEMLSGTAFGESGKTVVIEEFLQGIEISIFVLTDGQNYKLLPSAKDYKRVGEGDTGLNTGGMGAISPVPFATDSFLKKVEEDIVEPTISGLQAEGLRYKGFIFIGLMVVNGQPQVLEYNVRMGDPETEAIMPRLETDLVELFQAVTEGQLDQMEVHINPDTCATIMLVSGGYPGAYEKGKVITGWENVKGSRLFHAGTRKEGTNIKTNGGRVIAISSMGSNIEEAVNLSLENAEKIQFAGKYYRKDIGKDLMSWMV